jgi:hypothetical protein
MADVNEPKPEPVASSEPKLQPQETELATKPKDGEAAKENAAPVCIHSSARPWCALIFCVGWWLMDHRL